MKNFYTTFSFADESQNVASGEESQTEVILDETPDFGTPNLNDSEMDENPEEKQETNKESNSQAVPMSQDRESVSGETTMSQDNLKINNENQKDEESGIDQPTPMSQQSAAGSVDAEQSKKYD